MPITYEVRSDGILAVERSGVTHKEEEDASLQQRLADERIVPGMRSIVDSRGVSPADSCEVVQHVAAAVRANAARLGCGAVALVVKSDVQYGMARMYMALTDAEHPNTRVFRDYEEALTWLKSQPAGPAGRGSTGTPTGGSWVARFARGLREMIAPPNWRLQPTARRRHAVC